MWDVDAIEAAVRALGEEIRGERVEPELKRGDVLQYLSQRYSFDQPIALGDVTTDVHGLLLTGLTHATHPRYFGLYVPNVHPASVVADLLAAAFNPQVGGWFHGPAAVEIEEHVLRFVARKLGLPDDTAAHFTSGASEANFTAVVTAIANAFPDSRNEGLSGVARRPVFFVSTEAHHCFEKIAQQTGLGRDAVRLVDVDDFDQMRPEALEAAIAEADARGETPFLVVATAGTTAGGAIDPLGRIAEICAREKLWFHVDAAWGGAAALSDRLRDVVAGIELADSVTFDAHKWPSVAMGAGMFFTRRRDALEAAFNVTPPYVPKQTTQVPDFYRSTAQWSRRFIGLKLFMTLANLGASGLARHIERHVELAARLKRQLTWGGWHVMNRSMLAVVLFTHAALDDAKDHQAIVDKLRGRFWISTVARRDGSTLLRACITNYATSEADVDALVAALDQAVSELRPESAAASHRARA